MVNDMIRRWMANVWADAKSKDLTMAAVRSVTGHAASHEGLMNA
jgi:hypothetical protein